MMRTIKLSDIPKYKKFQLADLVGYKVEEINKNTGRCIILNADNYIDNDFKSIDDVLLLIRADLNSKEFSIVA